MILKKILLLGLALVVSENCYARWLSPAEAPYVINFKKTQFRIASDGSHEVETERLTEVLNEVGRQQVEQFVFTFDSSTESAEIIEAKVLNTGSTSIVPIVDIKTESLGQVGQIQEDSKVISFTFPDVKIGSKVYVRYRSRSRARIFGSWFSHLASIGKNESVQAYKIEFVSDEPLFAEAYDSDGYLTMAKSSENGKWRVEFNLEKPIYKSISNEENSIFDDKAVPWIAVSNKQKWSDIPAGPFKRFDQVVSGALPGEYQEVLARAKGLADDEAKINAVMSGMHDIMSYYSMDEVGAGYNFPRSFTRVVSLKRGDCKDFAAGTVAILRRLGFQADLVMIHGSKEYAGHFFSLPVHSFNHMVVRAAKNGVVRWLDPTRAASYSKGIQREIADRPALVIGSEGLDYVRTPALDPEGSKAKLELSIDVSAKDRIRGSGEVSLEGRWPAVLSKAAATMNQSDMQYMVIVLVDAPDGLLSPGFENSSFNPRVVSDYSSRFAFERDWHALVTSAGPAFRLNESKIASVFHFSVENRAGHLDLGELRSWHHKTSLRGMKTVLRKPTQCSGGSPWLDYSRKMYRDNGRITMLDDVKIKRGLVKTNEMKTSEFEKLQKNIEKCLGELAIVIDQ